MLHQKENLLLVQLTTTNLWFSDFVRGYKIVGMKWVNCIITPTLREKWTTLNNKNTEVTIIGWAFRES